MSDPSQQLTPLTVSGGLGADFIRNFSETSVTVAGPPGSGKRVGLVIPNLRRAPRPPKQ